MPFGCENIPRRTPPNGTGGEGVAAYYLNGERPPDIHLSRGSAALGPFVVSKGTHANHKASAESGVTLATTLGRAVSGRLDGLGKVLAPAAADVNDQIPGISGDRRGVSVEGNAPADDA